MFPSDRRRRLALLSALAFSLGTTTAGAGACRLAGRLPPGAVIASWYGREHHGHRTASGDAFDETALTAAHPHLPLRSLILVTNLLNGRTVKVQVTDRGPGHGRGLDLSQRAAEIIGLARCGLAPVRISTQPFTVAQE